MTPIQQQALLFFKSVAIRFAKGGLAGASAALVAVTIQAPQTWSELSTALIAVSYAAFVGFISGGILALEKWYNWTDAPVQ